MSNKVQSALEAREARKKKEWQDKSDKVTSALEARDNRIKSNLQSIVTDLQDRINSEYEALKNISTPSWGSDSLKQTLESTRQNTINIENLKKEVDAKRKYFGDETTDGALSALNQMSDAYDSYLSLAEGRSQFETEDDYNDTIAYQKEYEKKKTYDLEAGKAEIDDLQKKYDSISALKKKRDNLYGMIVTGYKRAGYSDTETKSIALEDSRIVKYDKELAQYGNLDDLKTEISQKEQYYNQAKQIQYGIKLTNNALAADDYSNYSQKGIEMGDDVKFGGYKNNIVGYRNEDDITDASRFIGGSGASSEAAFAKAMTDEEVGIYSYYLAKEGDEKAEEYLDSIRESVNNRIALGTYDTIKDNMILEYMFGVSAGLDQFASGIKNLFNFSDDYIPASSVQQASAMVREDLADVGGDFFGNSVGQTVYDMITTTANMAPSMAIGTLVNTVAPGVGSIIGNVSMGASSAGNAYAEMINAGYNKGQARAYSTLVGASEAYLEEMLGGIVPLKGGQGAFGGVAEKLAEKVSNTFLKAAIRFGGDMLSEGTEEYLQDVLEPWFRNITLRENNDITALSEDALYSGLLGALSAGILNGMNAGVNAKITYDKGSKAKELGLTNRLADLGKTYAADTVAYKISKKVNENTGAYTVGKLLNEVGASLSEQNLNDITSSLETKGVDPESAQTIANWLNKAVEGKYFTKQQRDALEKNDVISDVFKDVIINNSTVNTRTQGYNEVLSEISNENSRNSYNNTNDLTADNYSEVEPYNTLSNEGYERKISAATGRNVSDVLQEHPQQAKNIRANNSPSSNENIAEGGYDVSDNGKTIVTKTGEEVRINEIASIKDGEITLRLDNGETANASDVTYGSADEALIYETVADMGVNAAIANTIVNNFDINDGVSASTYALGIKEAYTYGRYNIPMKEMSQNGFCADLTEYQKVFAYKLGQSESKKVFSDVDTTKKTKHNSIREQKGGSEYGNYDTEVLGEKRNLWGTDRGNNSVRPQSKNSEKIYKWLGYGKADERSNGRRRIGSDGWLGKFEGSTASILRSGESFLRNLSGKRLRNVDSVGRKLSKELYQKLEKTVFKSENGTILSLYHWTDAEFERFEKGDIGFHFGTLDAARERQLSKQAQNDSGVSIFKEVYLNIQNPVVVDNDSMGWYVFSTSEMLLRKGVFSKKDIELLNKFDGYYRGVYGSKAVKEFKKLLNSKGYDGIIYNNRFEGGLSVIALEPDQIITVSENGIDKLNDIKVQLTKEQKLVQEIGQQLGRDVIFERTESTQDFHSDGYIDADGNIHIDYNCSNSINFVFKHELTHYGEGSAKYAEFCNAVTRSKTFKQWINKKITGNYTDAAKRGMYRAQIQNNYAKRGIKLSPMKANNEMIANFVGDNLFTDNGSGIRSILSDMNVSQRNSFVQFFIDFFKYVKGKISRKDVTFEIVKLERMFKETINTVEKGAVNNDGVRYSLRGTNEFGIEVYETSEEIKRLSYKERMKIFLDIMENRYHGRTAKFIRNGHAYYAKFEKNDVRKNIYGDNRSDSKGKRAKINIGADGTIFELVENSKYNGSRAETGKNIAAHKGVAYWDYFIKNIQIDNIVFDMVANVRKKSDGSYVYSIQLNENKKIETAPPLSSNKGALNRVLTASTDSISQNDLSVNNQSMQESVKYSIPDDTIVLLDSYDRGEISKDEYVSELNKLWHKSVDIYGAIEQGEKPQTDIKVPKKVDSNAPTKRFIRTVLKTGKIPEQMIDNFSSEVLLGNFKYSPISDKTAVDFADKTISNGVAEEFWNDAVIGKLGVNSDKKAIAVGEKLLLHAIDANDTKRVIELSAELSEMFTRGGQVVQAARMFKSMTGFGRLLGAQRNVDSINRELEQKYSKSKKAPTVKINETLASQLVESKEQSEIETVYEDLLQDIAAQVPSTFIDKWNAWRYFAMLANPTTHLRNLYGNAIFIPVVRCKDVIATEIERALIKDLSARSKSIVLKKEYRDFAKSDAERAEVQQILRSGGKMNPETEISKRQKIFNNNVLDSLIAKNNRLLENEDVIFKNIHYRHALASFLQARKIDVSKQVSENILIQAREYAKQEAYKATFNDASEFARALNRLSKKNLGADIFINGLVPFKQTPVNIIKRGVEYSPAGLLYTIGKGVYRLKRGSLNVSEFIDGLASGLTGTMIFALGMFLTSIGVISGGFDDDKEDEFKKLNGEQEYSVKICGYSYTIDWAAPLCIPLFMGVETMKSFENDDAEFKFSNITEPIWNMLEPVVNLSMLSGIQSTISSVKYADGATQLAAIIGNIGKSYITQALPTVGSKVAQTIDGTRRINYIDKNSQLDSFSQSLINTVKSKTPGLSSTRPEYIDAWGHTQESESVIGRIAQNFVSPGYASKIEYDEINTALKEIYDVTGDTTVFPSMAAKSFSVSGETKHLTADEYVKYARAKGQYSFDYVQEFINSSDFKILTDTQRVNIIQNLYKYANAKAKCEVSDYDLLSTFKSVTRFEREGGSVVDYYIIKSKEDEISSEYKLSDINSAFEIGNTDEALEKIGDIVTIKKESYINDGNTEKDAESKAKSSVKSSMTSYWKPLYLEAYKEKNDEEMLRIRKILLASELYGRGNDVARTVQKWIKNSTK